MSIYIMIGIGMIALAIACIFNTIMINRLYRILFGDHRKSNK